MRLSHAAACCVNRLYLQVAWHDYMHRKWAAQPLPPGTVKVTIAPGFFGVKLKRGAGFKGVVVAKFHRRKKAFFESSGVQRGWYLTRIDDINAEDMGFHAVVAMMRLRAKHERVVCFRPPTKQETLQLVMDGACSRREVTG